MTHARDPDTAADKPARPGPRGPSVRATPSISSMHPRDRVALSLLLKEDSARGQR